MRSLRIFTIIGLFCMTASRLMAQGQPRLEISIQELKVNMTEAERNGDADVVYSPGDTIEYTITAKNTGDGLMTNPEIVDPIPGGVVCIPETAAGENCRILFSVNGGLRYDAWPVRVLEEEGEREAGPEEITHVKWVIQENIPAGGQKILSFRVIVQ